jgi:hypothetical protein
MKKILILALTVVMSASVAYANPCVGGGYGAIGLFSDVAYTNCSLSPTVAYANYDVYVVHVGAVSATSSQFKVVSHAAGALLNQGTIDFGSNLTLGDPFTGITVTYGGCKTLPWLIATIPYFYFGTPGTDPVCTYFLQVEADPGSQTGQVEAIDCSGTTRVIYGLSLNFFGDPELCPCPELCVVATQPSSWSKIKSLYR